MNTLSDRLSLAALATLALTAFASPVLGQTCPSPSIADDVDGALRHVRYLADDALEGREVGSAGARCAADYIAARFEAAGLEPAGDEHGWFQNFVVRSGYELGNHNTLAVAGQSYTMGDGWVPFGFSGTGQAAGAASASEGLEEMAGGDEAGHGSLAGKVLILDMTTSADGADVHAAVPDPHRAASLAARMGAVAAIMLVDGTLPDISRESRPSVPVPTVAATGAVAEAIRAVAAAGGEIELMAHVERRSLDARNVVAILRGTERGDDAEAIVVGAHFDHLGFGGDGSLAPDDFGTVHNGADDNASGTAALIEVAETLAAGPRLRRTVVFVAFTGEEKGLWGSARYAEAPALANERTTAMLNMDMVGRLEDGKLTVFGVGTATEWPALLEEVNGELERPLPLATAPDGYGPSDHSSFYGKGIPVLHFFSNAHVDYHRPSDDWDLIDAEGLERVAGLVSAVASRLAGVGMGERVALSPIEGAGTPPAPAGQASGDSDEGASRGYGPYLGTIPDMTPGEEGGGIGLTGVRQGSPAEAAGLQGGDVIVEFGGQNVTDLYSYTYALRDHQAGDVVSIVVLRDGERLTLTATLGRR